MLSVFYSIYRIFARRTPRFSLALALGLLSVLPANAATTYYVSPSGNDNNSGSQAAPFRQIRAALSHVKAGDTVLVADGSYLGFNVDSLTGTATAPITIQAVGSNAVVTVTTDRSDNRDTIFITYSSYIVVNGLRSFNANRAAVRVDNSQNITVEHGTFGNNATWGIFTDFSDNLLIAYNECYGSVSQHGIYVSNSCVNPILRGNISHDNNSCGIHMNGDLSQGGVGLITGALIEDNIIYNNGAAGGSGIDMDGVQNSIIRNNLLYNNHATGIGLYQIDAAAGPKSDQVLNNTVDVASDGRWALLFKQTTGLNTVRNNILYNRGSYHGGLDCGTSADVPNVNSDYNIMDRVTTNDGDSVYTLAQWQALGYEPHSLSATPASLWVNPAAGNYHLLPSAPAIDAGVTLTNVTNDLDGNPRPVGSAFDIGCYEYTGISISSLTVSPHSATGGLSVQGTVTLTKAAPTNGSVVTLSSNNAAAVVPASITVPAGKSAVSFTIPTKPVTTDTTVTLSASYQSVTKTATLTVVAALKTNPSSFVLGINLGGNTAVTIEGNRWLAYNVALASGLSVTNAHAAATDPAAYSPTPDTNTTTMLNSCLWTSATATRGSFTLSQKLPNGSYKVYVWEVEDAADHAHNFNLALQGGQVATGIGNQLKGQWRKYGPYSATVSNGVLTLQVVHGTKGNPQLMGVAIFRQ